MTPLTPLEIMAARTAKAEAEIARLTEALEDEKAARLVIEKTNFWKLEVERLRAVLDRAQKRLFGHGPSTDPFYAEIRAALEPKT